MTAKSAKPTLGATLSVAALVAALGMSGCDYADGRRIASGVSQQADAAIQTVDDAAITAKVKVALAADAKLPSAGISVATSQGRVTLSGQVPDPVLVDQAEQTARLVRGVVGVENRLVRSSG